MAEPIAKMYYLLHHNKRLNGKMHKGVPSKIFMQKHPEVKGYMCTYILGCERVCEYFFYENERWKLNNTIVSEWKW